MRNLLSLLLLCPTLAIGASDQVDKRLDYLIKKQRLGSYNESFWQRCVRQAPRASEFAQHDLIRRYCLVRHGADRKQAIFLGTHASLLLEARGEQTASEIVDELLIFPDSKY